MTSTDVGRHADLGRDAPDEGPDGPSGTSGGAEAATGEHGRADAGADARPEALAPGKAGALLQRVIMPRPAEPLDVRALYLDEDESNTTRARLLDRGAVRVPPASGVSFATYFNAFPASYWRRWTTLDQVVLHLTVEGVARVDVYRSKADGAAIHVTGAVARGASAHARTVLEFVLDLAPFEDGGWYWFDVTTDDAAAVVTDSGWFAGGEAPGRASVAVGITTFNRPDDCVAALAALGEDAKVRDVLTAVFVADQGNRQVVDAAGYADAAAVLGDRLHVVRQGNIGGSGGFSRVMHEALVQTDADQILLMDDDIVIEPDSVLRALAFARFARSPMLVGGQMLNLQARSHLHSMGEVVDRDKFMWRAAPNVEYDHDFAKESLRETDWLHRRIDVDYNGWWMCMIPRQVAAEIGLPMPLFIKWDDAEYGLRAGEAGYPTASLPGVAIWHMPWSDKDDATDWQAYFHLRNRLVVAALHSPHHDGGLMVAHSMRSVLKHLMSLEYSTVALQRQAIADFLQGPGALADMLPTALGRVRAMRSDYPDGVVLPSSQDLPLPSMPLARVEKLLKPPTNPVTIAATLLDGIVHNTRPAKPAHHERPQLNIAARDARWFLLARLDGATVATADGRGVAFRKRDRAVFWGLLRGAVADHLRLRREFPALRREYQEALGTLTGVGTWERLYRS